MGKEYQSKQCARCGAEIKDREQGFNYGIVNISEKHYESEMKLGHVLGNDGKWHQRYYDHSSIKSHNMRPQVMLCMECAEKFVDVINDFVGVE